MNPDTVAYPDLISLEVSEADVLSRGADEQASRLRPSDAAAGKVKPEVHYIVFCFHNISSGVCISVSAVVKYCT